MYLVMSSTCSIVASEIRLEGCNSNFPDSMSVYYP